MNGWKESAEFARENEYRADDGSYVYVAGLAELSPDGSWNGVSFRNDELAVIEPSAALGIILAGGEPYNHDVLDHAPDALYAICSLDLVPDGIGRIICIDRRGLGKEATRLYVDRLVDGGAPVIYDTSPETPFDVAIPSDWIVSHHEWSPQYRSEVRFAGPLSALSPHAWARCHESLAAVECLHIRELLETGQTSRCGLENPSFADMLVAVKALGRKRVAAPEKFVSWAAKGVEALAWRDDIRLLGDPGHGSEILAVAAIWDMQLRRRRFRTHKPNRVAKIWGVDDMLDAYLSGVPIADVIA